MIKPAKNLRREQRRDGGYNMVPAYTLKEIELYVKGRKEAARFVEAQLDGSRDCTRNKNRYHYGRQDLRDLLDFIYRGPPETPDEEIRKEKR